MHGTKQPLSLKGLLPHELFELFLTNTEIERIFIKSTNCVRLKGNHMFTMAVEKLKAFLTILWVNWYPGIPRQEMYWERREDSHNLVVSAVMTKTHFLDGKRHLHLADNNSLNSSDKCLNVRLLFNAIKQQCILKYQPTQHVSIEKSMMPYFGKHGAKQYMKSKPIKFRFKLWVMATPLGYCIQFYPYADKDSIIQGYENIWLGLDASVVANLISKPPAMQISNYDIVMDNYFTIPALLRHLSAMWVLSTETVIPNMVKMNKEKFGSLDVVTDVSSNITAVPKDNKVMNAISAFTGKQPIQNSTGQTLLSSWKTESKY